MTQQSRKIKSLGTEQVSSFALLIQSHFQSLVFTERNPQARSCSLVGLAQGALDAGGSSGRSIKASMGREEVGQVTAGHRPILVAVLHQKPCQGSLNKAVLIPIGVVIEKGAHGLQKRFRHLSSQAHRAFPLTTTLPLGRPHEPLLSERPPHFSTARPWRQIESSRESGLLSHPKTAAAADPPETETASPLGSGPTTVCRQGAKPSERAFSPG